MIPTILYFESLMAVREGFEPSIRPKSYNELATRRIRPLCHLTVFYLLNKDKVDEYKSGKEKLFGYFVGQVMQETKGTANPGIVNEILKKKLAK